MENSERLNFEYWDNSKWPVVIVDLVNDDADRYFEILDWIRDNIDMPYRHSRWRWYEFYVEVKFRYEKDYIMFKLRWL
jgi:hypothetical protein